MIRTRSILWGIALIAVGLLWGLNILGIIEFHLLFDGWWTLFIIVPCLIDLFTGTEKTASLIGLVIGVLLLLSCQNLFSFRILWKLLVPFIIVVIGLRLIFKDFFRKKTNQIIKQIEAKGNFKEYNAVFSGQNLCFDGEIFEGAKLNSIFGGIKCDLRKAVIEKDTVIETFNIFGGSDILLPDNVNIKITSDSIFGGVSNKKACFVNESAPTVYIKASCIFGGVDIK